MLILAGQNVNILYVSAVLILVLSMNRNTSIYAAPAGILPTKSGRNSFSVIDEYVGLQTDSISSCSKISSAGVISATGSGATDVDDLAAAFRAGISCKNKNQYGL
jgi:NAD(P)H-nitrite reductase large subunit